MSSRNFGLGNIIKQSKENTPLADKAIADKIKVEKKQKECLAKVGSKESKQNNFLAPLAGSKGRKVNLELTDIQFEILDKASKDSRYSKREIMVMALKDYLEKNNYL
jgi:hypothetical protein